MFAIDNYDFTGKRAIIRVDFNVPLNGEGQVTDDTRKSEPREGYRMGPRG